MSPSTSDAFVYDVFVSYRQREPDKSWVRNTLVPALRDAGLKICLDDDCFTVGEAIVDEMERAVLESRYTVVVLTPAYQHSGFTKLESVMAEHIGLEQMARRLVPLMRERCDPGLRVRTRVWLDMTDDSQFAENVDRLIRALGSSAGR